jgi:hypothetical protein
LLQPAGCNGTGNLQGERAMTNNRQKRTVTEPVLPLPAEGTAAKAKLEEYRQRRRRARAQAYWAGRTLAMRRSGRAAA